MHRVMNHSQSCIKFVYFICKIVCVCICILFFQRLNLCHSAISHDSLFCPQDPQSTDELWCQFCQFLGKWTQWNCFQLVLPVCLAQEQLPRELKVSLQFIKLLLGFESTSVLAHNISHQAHFTTTHITLFIVASKLLFNRGMLGKTTNGCSGNFSWVAQCGFLV